MAHEMAIRKRLKFAAKSEAFNAISSAEEKSLREETIDTDLAALALEIEQREPASVAKASQDQPKRAALPAELPRTVHQHEPQNTHCQCGCALKRIGEDVAEKLDCRPGVFSVERHMRGPPGGGAPAPAVGLHSHRETCVQAPVPAHIIDTSQISQDRTSAAAMAGAATPACAQGLGDDVSYQSQLEALAGADRVH
jgi:transposase